MYEDEVITITRLDSTTFQALASWQAIASKIAIVDLEETDETVYALLDHGEWREMTEQELAQWRRAVDDDERDMARIAREWEAYRNQGLGKRG